MRSRLRHLIPSMFHRRLLLLAGVALGVAGVLTAQAARLTTGSNHAAARADAERPLVRTQYIPTVRGRILDRNGLVLAEDVASWSVAVDFDVISGEWARTQAERAARKAAGERWKPLGPGERARLVERELPRYTRQVEDLWSVLANDAAAAGADLPASANAAGVNPSGGPGVEGVLDRVERVRRRVARIKANVSKRHWQREMRERNEAVDWAASIVEVAEETQGHTILRDVPDRGRQLLEGLIVEANASGDDLDVRSVWRKVKLVRQKRREYPQETWRLVADRSTLPTPIRSDEPLELNVQGVATHILGLTRPVYAEDLAAHPFRTPAAPGGVDLTGYLDGDRTGGFGVERELEPLLRGRRGRVIRNLETGQISRLEPEPGRDVHLTIDARLQARIAAVMDPELGLMRVEPWHDAKAEEEGRLGQPLYGAAVVLDIATGEVLAAVSTPAMPLGQLYDDPDSIFHDTLDQPYLNRPVAQPYQPGSTIKPILLAIAATTGDLKPGELIQCTGHYLPNTDRIFKCWIYSHYGGLTHGPLAAPQAIAQSCNIFFYTLGERVAAEGLVRWYREFGLGVKPGSGQPDEAMGDLPDIGDLLKKKAYERRAMSINMGIGQGEVRWTPIQAASAYATLARGGEYVSPTFIAEKDRLAPRDRHTIPLDPGGISDALQGMEAVVHGDGTGRWLPINGREEIFNAAPGSPPHTPPHAPLVLGKSGTAQGVPQLEDLDRDGRPDPGGKVVKSGDHAWFTALVQPEGANRPTVVIAVVAEYAGSGGKVSGPIVNQIVHVLQEEGYLEPAAVDQPLSRQGSQEAPIRTLE